MPPEEVPTFARKGKPPPGTESIGFDLRESDQHHDYLSREALPRTKSFMLLRMVLLILAGLFTGAQAVLADVVLHFLYKLRFKINDAVVESSESAFAQGVVFVLVSVVFSCLAGYFVCYVQVLAAGSGIPEIKCYLNGINRPGVLEPVTLVAKMAGITFSCASGLHAGKEGPNIHCGAIVGALACRLGMEKWMRPINLEVEMRNFVGAGASAGVAGAFGAPVGGVLFAVEEGASFMTPDVLICLFVCSAASMLVMKKLVGTIDHDLPFDTMGEAIPEYFGRYQGMDYYLYELPIFIGIAVFCGLCGALFNSANKRLVLLRRSYGIAGMGHRRFLEVPVLTAIMTSLRFCILVGLAGGYATKKEDWTHNQELFVAPLGHVMTNMFHEESIDGQYDNGLLFTAFVLHFCLTCLTYGLGVPSGLFVPSLMTGSIFGRFIGELLHDTGGHFANPCNYALIGAASMMSGMGRITISLAVILIEASGSMSLCVPLFIVTIVSKMVGDIFNRSIYDLHIIELQKVPLLEHEPEHEMLELKVKNIMTTELVTLDPIMRVEKLCETLASCSHNGFPVLRPDSRELLGVATRANLLLVLQLGGKYGIFNGEEGPVGAPVVPFELVAWNQERKIPSVQDILDQMSMDEREAEIDIQPYLNCSGYSIPHHASVASAFCLFRKLGLRHLPVLGTGGAVVGILTRKDLILDEEEMHHIHKSNPKVTQWKESAVSMDSRKGVDMSLYLAYGASDTDLTATKDLRQAKSKMRDKLTPAHNPDLMVEDKACCSWLQRILG